MYFLEPKALRKTEESLITSDSGKSKEEFSTPISKTEDRNTEHRIEKSIN